MSKYTNHNLLFLVCETRNVGVSLRVLSGLILDKSDANHFEQEFTLCIFFNRRVLFA